ncbi:lysophospholipid acyltransferase family protein [Lutimonas sp.]|uniref:lysophospholipid acyltransferase family protein n=1 Tax=Lutimonas sp. TaxID=1872403 RepID=UPI003D9B1F14
MKKLWYLFVKYYMRTGFTFYFKKVQVSGTENVPKNTSILFVANHQNALIDPLLIGAYTPRELNFLTRSDVFSTPLIRALLYSVNMLPIYRIKDGIDSLSKNEEVFQKCYSILNKQGTLLIFPEGNHNIKRRLRILSKGFTRIVSGALEKKPDEDVYVLPIGINYTNARKYGSSVHIIYGKPIKATKDNLTNQNNGIKTEVSNALKKIITQIDDLENYDEIEQSFSEEEFMDPIAVNQKLQKLQAPFVKQDRQQSQFNFLTPFMKVNSFLPLLFWNYFNPKIGEVEFISTFRFTIGITLFPITYIIQSFVLSYFFGSTVGMIYLIISFLLAYLFVKSK